MTTTALIPAIERGKVALKTAGSLKAVAEAMVDEVEPVVFAETKPFPPPAPIIEITDDVTEALAALPVVFGKVQPSERRALTTEEVRALYDERAVLKIVMAALSGREEAIKTTIKHHLDVTAEESGRAVPKAVVRGGHVVVEPTLRDDKGHYILATQGNPERIPVPGTNQAWSREFRAGSLTVDGSLLDEMAENGAVPRSTYLSMTREARVFDEVKAMEAIKKDPSLLGIIKRISRRAAPGAALFVRKVN